MAVGLVVLAGVLGFRPVTINVTLPAPPPAETSARPVVEPPLPLPLPLPLPPPAVVPTPAVSIGTAERFTTPGGQTLVRAPVEQPGRVAVPPVTPHATMVAEGVPTNLNERPEKLPPPPVFAR